MVILWVSNLESKVFATNFQTRILSQKCLKLSEKIIKALNKMKENRGKASGLATIARFIESNNTDSINIPKPTPKKA